MSTLCYDIIAYASAFILWFPFLLGLISVLVILIIDMFRSADLKRDFYNKLPYHYRCVIDAYNHQNYLFFKKYQRDCMIFRSCEDFKQYEEHTKEFVDVEL